jgi:hypothetical protein
MPADLSAKPYHCIDWVPHNHGVGILFMFVQIGSRMDLADVLTATEQIEAAHARVKELSLNDHEVKYVARGVALLAASRKLMAEVYPIPDESIVVAMKKK